MVIRKAKIEDAKDLNNLLTLLIRDEKQYDDSIDENFTVTNMYENYIDDPTKFIYAAYIDDKIVGYLYGYCNDDSTLLIKKACLDALYVEKQYRGNGIANKLIEEFKKWASLKNVKVIEVSVMYENKVAKNLYQKHNFNPIKQTMECDIDKDL